jgi:hypothetical protein
MSNLNYAVYNPLDKNRSDLPVIYGFNNGGFRDTLGGILLAEDGTFLGSHICSSEGWMLHDLGIMINSRPDRHETFKKHYPDGYRMDFVSLADVETHAGIQKAVELNQAQVEEPETDGDN